MISSSMKLFFKPKAINYVTRSFHAARPVASNFHPLASVSDSGREESPENMVEWWRWKHESLPLSSDTQIALKVSWVQCERNDVGVGKLYQTVLKWFMIGSQYAPAAVVFVHWCLLRENIDIIEESANLFHRFRQTV